MMEEFFPGLSTVFYHLLTHSLEISVLIGLIFLLKRLAFKKLPPWWHYCLWLMLLIRMLVPLEFENRIHALNLIPPVVTEVFGRAVVPVYDFRIGETDAPGEISLPADTVAREFLTASHRSYDWREIIPILWFVGAIAFCLYISVKSLLFSMTIRGKSVVSDHKVISLLSDASRHMKINRKVSVVMTDRVNCPSLFGYFRPLLLLPEKMFDSLNREELTYAFMHELGHMKRHDIGVSWCVAFLQGVYWFNPFVWLAFHQMRLDQELACDATVLHHIRPGRSTDYAMAIVGFLERFCQNCHLPSLAGVLESRTQMFRRINGIVRYQRPSRRKSFGAVFLLLFAGVAFFAFTGSVSRKQAQADENPVVFKRSSKANFRMDMEKDNSSDAGKDEGIFMGESLGGEVELPMSEPRVYTISENKNIDVSGNGEHNLDGFIAGKGSAEETSPKFAAPGSFEIKVGANAGVSAESDPISIQVSGLKRSIERPRIVAEEPAVKTDDSFPNTQDVLLEDQNDYEMSVVHSETSKAANKSTMKTITQNNNNDTGRKVFMPSDVDTLPRAIRTYPPRYPHAAKRDNISGYITVQFVVSKDGYAVGSKVTVSEPEGVFDQTAIEAMRVYRFEPGTKGGKAVDVLVNLPIRFDLS